MFIFAVYMAFHCSLHAGEDDDFFSESFPYKGANVIYI